MIMLGIDVSKTKIDCCIFPQGLTGKRKNKIFTNTESGFGSLLKWLITLKIEPDQVTAIMEATSVYHENLGYYLYDAGVKVCVANPSRVRAFAKGMSMLNKTDKADSEALSRYGYTAKLIIWQPEPENVRLLKALLGRRDVYLGSLLQEKNRLEKAQSTHTSVVVIKLREENIEFLNQQLEHIDKLINNHIDQDPTLKQDLKLLQTIPSIGERSGLLLLGLFHSHKFEKASQAAAYVGLVPVHQLSGSSVNKQSHLSKASDSKIRSVLYMSALTAIKYNPHIEALYQRLLSRGKNKMCALGAAMCKLIHLCYGVLKHQTAYQRDYLLAE